MAPRFPKIVKVLATGSIKRVGLEIETLTGKIKTNESFAVYCLSKRYLEHPRINAAMKKPHF
jgi:hypothetical protein